MKTLSIEIDENRQSEIEVIPVIFNLSQSRKKMKRLGVTSFILKIIT